MKPPELILVLLALAACTGISRADWIPADVTDALSLRRQPTDAVLLPAIDLPAYAFTPDAPDPAPARGLATAFAAEDTLFAYDFRTSTTLLPLPRASNLPPFAIHGEYWAPTPFSVPPLPSDEPADTTHHRLIIGATVRIR